jgi:hypothetical protein
LLRELWLIWGLLAAFGLPLLAIGAVLWFAPAIVSNAQILILDKFQVL